MRVFFCAFDDSCENQSVSKLVTLYGRLTPLLMRGILHAVENISTICKFCWNPRSIGSVLEAYNTTEGTTEGEQAG